LGVGFAGSGFNGGGFGAGLSLMGMSGRLPFGVIGVRAVMPQQQPAGNLRWLEKAQDGDELAGAPG